MKIRRYKIKHSNIHFIVRDLGNGKFNGEVRIGFRPIKNVLNKKEEEIEVHKFTEDTEDNIFSRIIEWTKKHTRSFSIHDVEPMDDTGS